MNAGGGAAFRALIVMGVSGSGKSVIADALGRRLGWIVEDADRFHAKNSIDKMRDGIALTDDDRRPWLRAVAAEIGRRRADGTSVIMACSALKRAYRDILVQGSSDTRIIYLRGDKDLIASRLKTRSEHFMPQGLLASQFATLEEPTEDERPIVVDIDATIKDITERIIIALD
ncbi:gluconate kinase, SKI family [Nitrobacter winogradskyi Nb-255]|uniref:Gluconokinase n=1 Tax=Nitrobacter winogradskyi (strain ATCC 25391 / DSM 10237 / CIP 104748 / NCIMB 11846 / Nb-255) TaxID=323098 RepID=Q3SP93_NITWN|nr:gluconokinase [Nitrobacter winogradskyi]ABA05898.1 gluconate kinase, SKI family [Nitrobacter winogradskyi Nb-255]